MENLIQSIQDNLEQLLAHLMAQLLTLPPQPFPKTREEALASSPEPGVYVIYFQDDLIYVGETRGFASRINDHTYDSFIFSRGKEKSGLTARNDVRKWMAERFTYKFLPCKFGRLELEAFMVQQFFDKGYKLWNKHSYKKMWAINKT